MNFDRAVVQLEDGNERTVDPTEFLAIPLGDRIKLMTASKIKFYKNGQQISPLDAVRRPAAPTAT
ncbi:MAG: hypothetical protein ACLGH0_05125 [Thermoanaerobaculia bacterium]